MTSGKKQSLTGFLISNPDPEYWRSTIRAIPIGKRVGESVYLHASAIETVSQVVWEIALMAGDIRHRVLGGNSKGFTLVKFSQRKPVVSLLYYPTFFEDAFPAINHAYTVDLKAETVKERDYSKYTNKPILHRKELFLAKDHPRYEEFAAMTRTIEELGLFHDAKLIGYEWAWGQRLAEAGVKVSGNQITVPCPAEAIA